MRWTKSDYHLSTDKTLLQQGMIYDFLKDAPWCQGIEPDTLALAIEQSLCFGLYFQKNQIGFARLVTDYATFAWLTDLFVLEEHRGKGLSKWMMECIMQHPSVQRLRHISLATTDAHGLYSQYGFAPVASPSQLMEQRGKDKLH
ncbi:GNAT family N-acetyltransferase [Dongshaea marina]|uniref:GNAT family N-acetyltransferase n=1 Tax=Dongshaea marina TaxID=2047966 RepID=UPI000D3EB1BB|nr:GNAT family N-acetyltransferase [Dongshaea marina]